MNRVKDISLIIFLKKISNTSPQNTENNAIYTTTICRQLFCVCLALDFSLLSFSINIKK